MRSGFLSWIRMRTGPRALPEACKRVSSTLGAYAARQFSGENAHMRAAQKKDIECSRKPAALDIVLVSGDSALAKNSQHKIGARDFTVVGNNGGQRETSRHRYRRHHSQTRGRLEVAIETLPGAAGDARPPHAPTNRSDSLEPLGARAIIRSIATNPSPNPCLEPHRAQ